ncbi:hypothetical protein JCM14469_39910 [Desulfatiferula olefinivorans]
MERLVRYLMVAVMITGLALAGAACSKDDPVKDAGKKMEKAFDDAKKKVKKAVD